MIRRRSLLAATSLAALTAPARAQLADRPIRIVVPFPAGGGADLFARVIGQDITTRLARTIVVENRSGASGNIGVESVVRSPADGHTILYTTATIAINQSMFRRLPFDPARDLAPLVLVCAQPHILVATPRSGIRNFGDFVVQARQRPGELSYASPGSGTSAHLTMELLRARLGIEVTHIPYRGGGPAGNALLAGDTPVGISVGAVLKTHIDEGRLIALATTGAERLSILPDTPTVAELGQREVVTEQWHATFAPAATPAPIRAQLAEALMAAIATPAVRERFAEDGARYANLPPEEATAFIEAERPKWAEMVRISGATAG